MHRHPIETSNHITGAGYDPVQRTLELEFANGNVYHYHGVPQKVYQEFLDSPSRGQHFHNNIKSIYDTTRVK